MAILSAHSRRSPMSTAEFSPTLEQQFDNIDVQDSDEKIKLVNTATENTGRESAEENSAEVEARLSFYPTCVTEVNMMIENRPEEEEEGEEKSDLNGFSKQINIEKETPELDKELVSKMEDNRRQDVVTHLEILVSKETKKLENFPEMEQHARSKPQTLRKVFRGDSRDSGIGDCSSGQVTFSLQVDEQGIVSITEEEIDHETHTRENKRTLMEEEKKRDLTTEILTSSMQDEDTPSHVTESTTDDGKVASTKSGVTKASCETNSVRKGV